MLVCCALTAMAVPVADASGLEIERYSLSSTEAGGSSDNQAGSHPYELDVGVTFKLNGQVLDDLGLELPAGVALDPLALPRCSGVVVPSAGTCPDSAAVGVASVTVSGKANLVPVYNMAPARGKVISVGFGVDGEPVIFEGSVRPGDYGLTLNASHVSQLVSLEAVALTLWGVPGDSRHDEQRGECLGKPGAKCSSGVPAAPFVTLPTSCAVGIDTQTAAQADSWQAPGMWSSMSSSFAVMSGCQALSFGPTLAVAPEVTQASTPTGYTIGLSLAQDQTPEGLGTAELENVSVTLPVGTSLSVPAISQLSGCEEAQFALRSGGPAMCPSGSRLGSVSIVTPVLADPLEGAIFHATPYANPLGALVGLYFAVEDPISDTSVKIVGQISLDQSTGQPTIQLEGVPQMPLSSMSLHFFGGAKAPLSNPPSCGSAVITGALSPWSGSAPAEPLSSFTIDSLATGEACGVSRSSAPAQQVQVTSAKVGGSGLFVVSSRVMLTAGRLARIRLRCEGKSCRGRLLLQAKESVRRRRGQIASRTVTIGTTSYSIPAGKTGTVTVHLNRLGRRLLHAGHGRLLAVATAVPRSGGGEARAIQLVQRPTRRRRGTPGGHRRGGGGR